MIRIAIIRSASSSVPKNGYNIQELGLAKALVQHGMVVDVFIISDTGRTYTEKPLGDDRLILYRLKGYKIPGQQGVYPDLLKILKYKDYDIIQALDDSQIATVIVSIFCHKRNIKFVLWQGMYEDYPEAYKRIIQFFYDRTFLKILRKNTEYCISKTSYAKKYIEKKGFHVSATIPVGLEVSSFCNPVSIDYREKLEIGAEKKIILYVGKVEARRNPLFCLDVYSEVRKKRENCAMVFVGKGPMLEETKNHVDKEHIEDVHFVDFIPQQEIALLYEISDIFMFPTRYEIFGMVMLEAMYFNTPVITYSAAGPVDVIDNGVDGIIMDNFDATKWACQIENLFADNEEKLDKMKEKAGEKIRENYLWDTIGKRYHKQYMDIING